MAFFSLGKVLRFFLKRTFEGAIVSAIFIIILLYVPNIPPHCTFDKPFKLAKTLPLEGKLALNDKLNNVEFLFNGTIDGPEAFISMRGMLFTGTNDGVITKINKGISLYRKLGKKCEEFKPSVCGRPLGIDLDKEQNLIVADAYLGIWKVEPHQSQLLVDPKVEIAGKKPKLFNSVAVASNGDIYWTDSCTQFTLEDGLFTAFADPTGRLVKYDSKTKKNTVLLDNLHFANGVILTKNEDALIVAETMRSVLHKYDLKTGKSKVLIEGLPGMPDNLHKDGQGGVLVPLVSSHDANHPNLLQSIGQFPKIRKVLAKMLGLIELTFKSIDNYYENSYSKMAVHAIGHLGIARYMPKPKRATILHIDENGNILNSWHATDGKLNFVSEAYIYKDHLYMGSPWNDYIARVPVNRLGLPAQKEEIVAQKPTTQKPVTQTPTTQKPTTTTQKPTPTTQKPTTTTQKPTTTTQKPTTSKPATTAEKAKTKPAETVVKQETKKTAPKVESPKPAAQPAQKKVTPEPKKVKPNEKPSVVKKEAVKEKPIKVDNNQRKESAKATTSQGPTN